MQAIIVTEPGPVAHLQYTTVPQPEAGPGEVLIQVKAISINPVDIKTREGYGVYGRLKEQRPLIIGWDISGIVTAVGPGGTRFKTGDEVFGMINFPGHGQAYAQYVVAPESHLALKPGNISHEEAAATTLAALTAYQVLTQAVTLQPGQKILIHAAAGGVGHYAVQIAKLLGAYVYGTASGYNEAFVQSLGADVFIDYTREDFEQKATGMDIILDTLAGDTLRRSFSSVKDGGTIITIPSGVPTDISGLGKDRNIHTKFVLVQSSGADMQQIAAWLQQGRLKATVSHIFPFTQIREAHTQVATGKTRGKVVVVID